MDELIKQRQQKRNKMDLIEKSKTETDLLYFFLKGESIV